MSVVDAFILVAVGDHIKRIWGLLAFDLVGAALRTFTHAVKGAPDCILSVFN